jgi:hypothetical protein
MAPAASIDEPVDLHRDCVADLVVGRFDHLEERLLGNLHLNVRLDDVTVESQCSLVLSTWV